MKPRYTRWWVLKWSSPWGGLLNSVLSGAWINKQLQVARIVGTLHSDQWKVRFCWKTFVAIDKKINRQKRSYSLKLYPLSIRWSSFDKLTNHIPCSIIMVQCNFLNSKSNRFPQLPVWVICTVWCNVSWQFVDISQVYCWFPTKNGIFHSPYIAYTDGEYTFFIETGVFQYQQS